MWARHANTHVDCKAGSLYYVGNTVEQISYTKFLRKNRAQRSVNDSWETTNHVSLGFAPFIAPIKNNLQFPIGQPQFKGEPCSVTCTSFVCVCVSQIMK